MVTHRTGFLQPACLKTPASAKSNFDVRSEPESGSGSHHARRILTVANGPEHNPTMARLGETNLILAEAEQDVRGRKVVDRHGKDIGHVTDLFIDEEERKVRMLQIKAGGFLGLGEKHFLLPSDAISDVRESEVHVNVTLEHIVASPAYDPDLIPAPTQEFCGQYYGYYGMRPYWPTIA
jgi:sporulation protein YlmC with PRC-barrel domain